MNKPNPRHLQERCEQFNARHACFTPVRYHSVIGEGPGISTRTRSAAYILSGHTAVIFVEGVSGCVALDAVEVENA